MARAFTPEEKAQAKRDFLDALRESGSISAAAIIVGFQRTTYYNWADKDPEFKAAAREITKHSGEELVNTLYRRALDDENPQANKCAELWMRHHGMLRDVQEVRTLDAVGIKFRPPDPEPEGDDDGDND